MKIADLEKEFIKLTDKQVAKLNRKWLETERKIKMPALDADYDTWLDFFRTKTSDELDFIASTLPLSVEADAARLRWLSILENPAQMEKLHQARLARNRKTKSIVELAQSNDPLDVLYELRDRVAAELDAGVFRPADLSRLAENMKVLTSEITEIESRRGPKGNTKLAQLIASPKVAKKTVKKRRTIEDIEKEAKNGKSSRKTAKK